MIDYKKLELAHKLAEELTIDSGKRADVYVSVYHVDIPVYGLRHNIREETMPYETMNIDDLISKLKELAKPNYVVGQKAWFMLNNESMESVINAAIGNTKEYRIDPYGWFDEEKLYPSRESLIDAQIEYWSNLVGNFKCQHCSSIRNKRYPNLHCCSKYESCTKSEEKSTGSEDVSMSPSFEGEVKGFNQQSCEHKDEYIDLTGKPRCRTCMKLLYHECDHETGDIHASMPAKDIICTKCGSYFLRPFIYKCEHESDNHIYDMNGQRDYNPLIKQDLHFKCIHCGELYK